MQLSLHADLALRDMLDLAASGQRSLSTTAEIAGRFKVSLHHLQKVVQSLRKKGLVTTVQGVGGGIKLAVDPSSIRLGSTIQALEGIGYVADCARGPCPLAGSCRLKAALDAAERAFYQHLQTYTLADMLEQPTARVLAFLRRA